MVEAGVREGEEGVNSRLNNPNHKSLSAPERLLFLTGFFLSHKVFSYGAPHNIHHVDQPLQVGGVCVYVNDHLL